MKVFRRNKKPVQTLDDIVFENRNKGYGCYNLRTTYQRRLRISFILVLLVFLLATLIIYFWKINPLIERTDNLESTLLESVEYNPGVLPMIIRLPDILEVKPAAFDVNAKQNSTIEQQERTKLKAAITLTESKPVPAIADTSFEKLAEILLKRHKDDMAKEASAQTDSIKFVLEKVPQFPGGNTAIQYYFYRNQRYPINALLAVRQGSTIVSFVVNEKGIVEQAKVVSGIDPELDMEAIRLVQSMPHWQPAYYKGKPIACILVMPVEFAIK